MPVRQPRRRPAIGQRLRRRLPSPGIGWRGCLPLRLLSARVRKDHAYQSRYTRSHHKAPSRLPFHTESPRLYVYGTFPTYKPFQTKKSMTFSKALFAIHVRGNCANLASPECGLEGCEPGSWAEAV